MGYVMMGANPPGALSGHLNNYLRTSPGLPDGDIISYVYQTTTILSTVEEVTPQNDTVFKTTINSTFNNFINIYASGNSSIDMFFNGSFPEFPFWSVVIDKKNLLPSPLPSSTVVTFMTLYLIIICNAVIGNSLVLVMMGCVKKQRTVTDMYILSLATSDLLIATLNMPFQLYFIVANEWMAGGRTGLFLCKFTNFIQGLTVVASILTLLFIAIDRYVVICDLKLAHRIHNGRAATVIIVVVWGVSACILSPHLLFQRLDQRIKVSYSDGFLFMEGFGYVCAEFYPDEYGSKIFTAFTYIFLYIVPVLVMAFSYGKIGYRLWIHQPVGDILENPQNHMRNSKQRKRVIKMLMLVFLTFTILWLPFFTFSLYREFADDDDSFRIKSAVLKLIGYSNCCVNPIIYTFLNKNFQNEFIRLCCKNKVFVTSGNNKTESVRNTKV